jgi:hypothetical protein
LRRSLHKDPYLLDRKDSRDHRAPGFPAADRALGAGGTQHRHHIDGCFAHQRLNKSILLVGVRHYPQVSIKLPILNDFLRFLYPQLSAVLYQKPLLIVSADISGGTETCSQRNTSRMLRRASFRRERPLSGGQPHGLQAMAPAILPAWGSRRHRSCAGVRRVRHPCSGSRKGFRFPPSSRVWPCPHSSKANVIWPSGGRRSCEDAWNVVPLGG